MRRTILARAHDARGLVALLLLGALAGAGRTARAAGRCLCVASAAGCSPPQGSCRQSDDRREGAPRSTPVLRHAALGQRHLRVRVVPSAEALAFTDGRPHALGSTGQPHARSAMSLTNVAFNASYGWADSRDADARGADGRADVQRAPDRNGHQGQRIGDRVAGLRGIRPRRGCSGRVSVGSRSRCTTIVKAIASFERTLISANSPLDRYLYRDDRSALSAAAQRGMSLFFSERLACAHCHTGFNLSGPTVHDGSADSGTDVSQYRALQRRWTGRVSVNRSRARSTRRTWHPTWADSVRRRCATLR